MRKYNLSSEVKSFDDDFLLFFNAIFYVNSFNLKLAQIYY
jgi:hypothetical protein